MTRADLVETTDKCITSAGLASKRLRILPKGTLLYSMYASLGKVAVLGLPATVNQAILGIVPDCGKSVQEFLRYWLIQMESHLGLFSSSNTQDNLNAGKVRSLPLFVPKLDEQTAIATFLDYETVKIDALVREQRRLIELLKENRQAVISHAVTRGLNPHAPMRPSGIDWIGDIPKHWETRTIAKTSTKITNGYVGPISDKLVAAGVPYIQATHIKGGRINFDDGYFVTQEWSKAHAKSILAEGDVLIVQTGAGTGDIGLVSVNEVGFNCHALIIVTCLEELLSGAFLAAVLQSDYGHQKLESIQTGGMHPHLNCGNVKYVEVPVPPRNEQAAIVEHICEKSTSFDALTGEAERAIELLQERRTALISAAVTGKIDVRGTCGSIGILNAALQIPNLDDTIILNSKALGYGE